LTFRVADSGEPTQIHRLYRHKFFLCVSGLATPYNRNLVSQATADEKVTLHGITSGKPTQMCFHSRHTFSPCVSGLATPYNIGGKYNGN